MQQINLTGNIKNTFEWKNYVCAFIDYAFIGLYPIFSSNIL